MIQKTPASAPRTVPGELLLGKTYENLFGRALLFASGWAGGPSAAPSPFDDCGRGRGIGGMEQIQKADAITD